jgi:hypothetical protein
MENIKSGNINPNNVLCIMAGGAVLPSDISLNILTVSKMEWESSHYRQAYDIVKEWLPKEMFRFTGTRFTESFSLMVRKKIC